jgi:predicted membrane metal-binding protein
MAGNFHESFAQDAVKPPSERGTGLVFAGVAILVAVLWRNDPLVFWWALAIAAALALVSLLAPRLLKPLNILWFKLGLVLHRIVNPIVMLALFTVVFVPAGALMRLWHDPLRLRRKPEAATYWIDRKTSEHAGGSMRNQF